MFSYFSPLTFVILNYSTLQIFSLSWNPKSESFKLKVWELDGSMHMQREDFYGEH